MEQRQHVFIIGSKGVPAKYGGFETFVDRLVTLSLNENTIYHVSCLNDGDEPRYGRAERLNIAPPNLGSATAVIYDLMSLNRAIREIQKSGVSNAVIYILAARIGIFMFLYSRRLRNLGIRVFLNPDGHEWKRGKWNRAVRAYWKVSERLCIKHADMIICDSKAIETYVQTEYASYKKETCFIPYGADIETDNATQSDVNEQEWYEKHGVSRNEYYLIVGRFVPENNLEYILSEFISSNCKKDLVIITGIKKDKFYKQIITNTKCDRDPRVKFVGTVYNKQLLQIIRKNAFAYIHGHEVGGTNPSLLEALSCTKLNLLLNVVFNREVAQNGAVYFHKKRGDLRSFMEEVENWDIHRIDKIGTLAQKRMKEYYSWKDVIKSYESLFAGE